MRRVAFVLLGVWLGGCVQGDEVFPAEAGVDNRLPRAGAALFTTLQNVALEIVLTGSDPDGDPLVFEIVESAAHGVLLAGGSGDRGARAGGERVHYTPDIDFFGVDGFAFRVSDGQAWSEPARVTLSVNLPSCGDGVLSAGEECDDENLVTGDGCSASCLLEPTFYAAPPERISGALRCSTAYSNTGRKVSLDTFGRVYGAMICRDGLHTVTSGDGGATWSPPQMLGLDAASPEDLAPDGAGSDEIDELEAAIAGGPEGVAYVAAVAQRGLYVSRTEDGGITWTPPELLDDAPIDTQVSMATRGDAVFIAIVVDGGIRVYHSDDGGRSGFAAHLVAQENFYIDVVVDERSGDVFTVSEFSEIFIRRSGDTSMPFDPVISPPGLSAFMDVAGARGQLYIVGGSFFSSGTEVLAIPMNALHTSRTIPGLPPNNIYHARAIAANELGHAYVVTALDDDTIQLDRVGFQAEEVAADDQRALGEGGFPAVAALPRDDGAVVLFEGEDGGVFATVVLY
ncbi:Ig-like domain-containing protein [Haliangium ochraceum]|uniref:Cysteine-rich repeat protein n=1 Tax=Haliangium ochraceum (strain DSM 14365 / JCM 11303 / SMP-2) TaxID=502025 RepID=D0LG34_HALO1|nr:Ig-like domain-containing protein [Haliangium ochraceum]ACY18059.1 cysteine-rich repeat protein [Haliangium ochraceum DSM 14365]